MTSLAYYINNGVEYTPNNYINWAEGLRRVSGKEELYISLLHKFCNGNYTESVKSAWRSGNQEQVEAYVHQIKGIAGNLALSGLYRSSIKLEKDLRGGKRAFQSFVKFLKHMANTIQYITLST